MTIVFRSPSCALCGDEAPSDERLLREWGTWVTDVTTGKTFLCCNACMEHPSQEEESSSSLPRK